MATSTKIDNIIGEDTQIHVGDRWGRLRSFMLGLLTLGLLAITFALDMVTPLGIADWATYPIAVLSALLWKGGRAVLPVTVTAIALTVIGEWLSPPGDLMKDMVNRLIGASTIGLLGWLCLYVDRSEQALRDALAGRKARDERLRLFVESMKDHAIVLLDPKGRVSSWHGGAELMTGYREAEILGRPVSSFYPPKDSAQGKPDCLLSMAAAEGRAEDEGWRLRKDHSHFWAHSIVIPLKNTAGQIRGFATVMRDLTKRKQVEETLRESERHISTLIGKLPGVAYRCCNDWDRTLEYVSDGVFELTGYRPEDFTETRSVSFAQLIHPEDQNRVWSWVQEAVQHRRPYQLVYRIRTADGEEKWVWEQGEGSFSPHGQLLALEGFFADIT
ncbi:MAG: PAS domain-containing protein [Nitrospiraceae bacterium]